MRALVLGITFLSVLSSCKRNFWSDTKSYLGIEAAERFDFTEAPTFELLSDWFQKRVISEGTAKEVLNMATSSDLSQYVATNMLRYITVEIKKGELIESYLNGNKYAEIDSRLDEESKEIYDIIAALVVPNFDFSNMRTNDEFAKFIIGGRKVQAPRFHEYFKELRRSFVDRKGASIEYIATNLEAERKKFAERLKLIYLGNDGPSRARGIALLRKNNTENLTSLRVWENALRQNGANTAINPPALKGSSAGFVGAYGNMMGATSAPDKLPNLPGINDVPADPGAAVPGVPGGPVPPIPSTPIATCPYGAFPFNCSEGGTACVTPPANPSIVCSIKGLNELLAKSGGAKLTGYGLANDAPKLPPLPKPRFSCDERGYSGNAKYFCEYYASIQRPLKIKPNYSLQAPSTGMNLATTGTRYLMEPGIATPVPQQQGPSCAAYGLMSTVDGIIAAMTKSNKNVTYAEPLWQMHVSQDPAGGENGANMEEMIKLAQSGKGIIGAGSVKAKIKSYKALNGVDDIKAVLNKVPKKAVYVGLDIGDSWVGGGDNASGGTASTSILDCAGGVGGHAFTIYGYNDAQKIFYIKNSWDNTWGFSGYHSVPFDCFASKGSMVEMYEIDVELVNG